MGGMTGFINQQAAQQQVAPTATAVAPSVPTTTFDSGETQIPQSAPEITPFSPGSIGDLENRAAQAPQQIGQQFQQQRTPQQAPGQFSADNPYLPILSDYQARAQATAPKEPRTGVKGLLTSFFNGAGSSMMVQAGLTPPDVRHQQILQHLGTMTQMASQWEEMQGLSRYRDAMTSKMQSDQQFEGQMRPYQLQEAQQAVQRGQEAANTIHPAMSASDLKSLGVPDDLASQYQGKPLTSADFTALKDLSAAGATRIYDYGKDGTGQGSGQWLVDRNFNPIKQLSPVSETGRATALQKQQFAQQNALLKGAGASVYAYDPNQKATVLTTQAQAQQNGMVNVRPVKESDIKGDTHDTRVLNDVATKANNVMESADALNQDPAQRAMIAWAIDQASKEGQVRAGAFGVNLPTAWINNGFQSAEMMNATPATRDYVTNVLSLREASMGLQKVLTGSARSNEQQILALQATLPGFEADPSMARQKLRSFTQNVDLLRQGIPRMQGLDVVPVKTWSGPQSSVKQSNGQQQQNPGIGGYISTGADAVKHRVLRGLGLEGGGI